MVIKEQLKGVSGARIVLYSTMSADKVVKSVAKENTSNTDVCQASPKGQSLLDYLYFIMCLLFIVYLFAL